MTKKNETTDVAVISTSSFLAFQGDIDIVELMKVNMANEDFGPNDLTKIKVPGSAGQSFELETSAGIKVATEFTGVILAIQPLRVYWEKPYGEGEILPPDCASTNMIHGLGNPGGLCEACPLNKFGSGKNDSKACKERRNVYILLEHSRLPYCLSVPVQSVKAFRKYIQSLTAGGDLFYNVVTVVGLGKTTNTKGTAYSLLKFRKGGDVGKDHMAKIAQLAGELKDSMKKYKVDAEAQNGENSESPAFTS